MSTHGKSAISSSDRTRTDVKKEIPVNESKSIASKNLEVQNLNNIEKTISKPKVKRRINQKRMSTFVIVIF